MISIITNLYNSGKFIPKLMASVAAQTYTDWQLVCVNDCSPGRDSEIVRAQARKLDIADKVVLVENSVNQGVSRAKATGIKAATGEYMTFIDGDDWLAPQALERMIDAALRHKVDFVNVNYYTTHPLLGKKQVRVPWPPRDYDRRLDRAEVVDRCLVNFLGPQFFPYAYWAKLYRGEVLRNLRYDYPAADDVVGEDRWFNLEVFKAIDSACFVDYPGYYWRFGGMSTTMRSSKTWTYQAYLQDEYRHFDMINDVIRKYGCDQAIERHLYLLDYILKTLVLQQMEQGVPAEEIKRLISENISLRYYDDFPRLLDCEPYAFDRPVISAIIDRDADRLYMLLRQIYKKAWRGRLKRRLEDLLILPFR